MTFRRITTLLGLWLMAAATAGAEPSLRCLWTPPRAVRAPARPGTARIQYTQFFDDAVARALERSLGPERTLRFRYQTDYPDDHVFPNGVSMGRIHQWLSAMLDAWNREPLMPLRLSLERGRPDTENVIVLDEASGETVANSGRGGYSYEFDGETIKFTCRAVLNVDEGSVTRRELMEALAKHELGHCLALRHSGSRAAAMGYSTGRVEYGASVGFLSMDDLLGLRSVWARNSPGFGSIEGHLLYADGSPVGGGDVVAIDPATGAVLASGVSEGQRDGYFRIELPAGRRVRLLAHPLHADAEILGEHFLPSDMISPQKFAPTELTEGDQRVVLTVPDASTLRLPDFSVSPPADEPLENLDAPVTSILPGQRAHLAFRLAVPDDAPVEVRTSLVGLTVSHVTRIEDRVEFDVTAAAEISGASIVEFRSGDAVNVQVGSIWVRPPAGLVRALAVAPAALVRGETAVLSVTGIGLDRVTGARLLPEEGGLELEARSVESSAEGRLRVEVEIPSDAPDGPWELLLLTSEGETPLAPEPRPHLWTTSGRAEAQTAVDLGDVPVGETVEVSVELTNRSATSYQVTGYRWLPWLGEIDSPEVTESPRLAAGSAGRLKLRFTPQLLGPTVVQFVWQAEDQPDAVTEVRLWAVP